MDSLTHLALGACIGDAFLGKNIGKKAMAWGAIAQSLPDIDVLAGLWLSPSENLLAHRGFTHSILFASIAFPVLAILADRWHRPHNVKMTRWLWFFATEIFLHIFLDGFNTYGIGWLEPFSHFRFALNTIYVADPLFSIFPGVAALVLLLLPSKYNKRKYWYVAGITGSSLYLGVCLVDKFRIERDFRDILVKRNISYSRYMTTPTPFNNLLWYVVAGNDSGYYIGFRSLNDKQLLKLHYFPRNEHLLANITDHESIHRLKRFSKSFYVIEERKGSIVFNDIRFGQIAGWKHPDAEFVFYYYLQDESNNDLVMQRGRFKGWDREIWISLLERIRGN